MAKQDPKGTALSDIAVELSAVSKTFHQRQRNEQLSGILRNLLRPEFKSIPALSGLSLAINRGEILAYAGANGAGKSTTVKLCCGMLAPDSGEVRVLGMNPLSDRLKCVSRIGVVFGQRTELWFDHPVSASFEWKRVVWDIPDDSYRVALKRMKDLLGLDEFFNTQARELSLGQRMRADLGLALVHDPEMLFLDEPTLGLDVLARRSILGFLKELNRTRGVTIIVTSHQTADLEELAGRIVLIHKGKLAFDGSFDALRKTCGDTRRLILEADAVTAPDMSAMGARLVSTEGRHHEYLFDASRNTIAEILSEAARQCAILDVETHRTDIDDVVADIYETWQRGQHPTGE